MLEAGSLSSFAFTLKNINVTEKKFMSFKLIIAFRNQIKE